jgi:2,3-bisphosphoglycerate-independent phosphoglycerate mutase
MNLQVPIVIGGPGIHPNVRFRDNIRNAGLANVAATYMNLMGFEAPYYYEPSLLTFDYNPWMFTGVHEEYVPPMDRQRAVIKK